MKIITRGKGLERWSIIFRNMQIDKTSPLSLKFDWRDEDGVHQIIIDFNEYETKLIKKAFKRC